MKTAVVLALATGSLATLFEVSGIFPRAGTQVACSELGRKDCGQICIDQTATCCPNQQGGCPASAVCVLGSNGQYGCCPVGQTCQGPGGSDITTDTINSSGSYTTVPVPQSTTSVEVETTTAEPTETVTPTPTITNQIGTIGTITTAPAPTGGSNATATVTGPPITAGAAVNGFAASGVLGGLVAVIAAFL